MFSVSGTTLKLIAARSFYVARVLDNTVSISEVLIWKLNDRLAIALNILLAFVKVRIRKPLVSTY